jgi:hypothetical protein
LNGSPISCVVYRVNATVTTLVGATRMTHAYRIFLRTSRARHPRIRLFAAACDETEQSADNDPAADQASGHSPQWRGQHLQGIRLDHEVELMSPVAWRVE